MGSQGKCSCIDSGLLLIRVILGVVFLFHGSQKIFGAFGGPGFEGTVGMMTKLNLPVPEISAALSSAAEFGGAIILLLGTGTRIAAGIMAFNMLVAILTVHRNAFSAQAGGMEYPLTLMIVLIALTMTGPGAFTVSRLSRSRPKDPLADSD